MRKPGYKTTETWATAGYALVLVLNRKLDLGISDENCMVLGGVIAALIAGRSFVKGKAGTSAVAMACSVLLLTVGCARFTTTQRDISYGTNGEPARLIVTRATATTFFEGKSDLAKFRASQTDKSQTATVGTLGQETTSTNLAPVVEAVATGVAKGVAEAAKGGL